MAYGTVKVDNVTFTYNSADATTTFSGFYASTTNNLTLSGTASAATFTGTTANFTNVNAQNISVTTALSGLAITGGTAGFTTVTGTTVTGTTANFVSGVFTTRVSGTTITGTTASFTSGVFTSLSGTTHTITSGVFASGTAALPSISFVSDPNTGVFSPGADQLAVATNGTQKLIVLSNGNVGIGTSAPSSLLHVSNGNILLSNAYYLASRNAADNANLSLIGRDTSNNVLIDPDQYGTKIGGTTLVTTSTGRVGIGTTDARGVLRLAGSSANAFPNNGGLLWLTDTNAATDYKNWSVSSINGEFGVARGSEAFNTAQNAYKITGAATQGYIGEHIWYTNNSSEKVRIDNSGRLLVGTSNARSNVYNTTYAPQIQLEGNDNSNSALSIISCFNGTSIGGQLILGKANSGSVGVNGIVASGNPIGRLSFQGNDGSEFVEGAAIIAEVDGTPGANDMPGRLVFSTTADGGSSPNTSPPAMTIKSSQEVLIGTSTITANGGILQLKSGITFPATAVAASDPNTLDDYEEGTWTPAYTGFTTNSGTLTAVATYVKIGLTVMYQWQQTGGNISTSAGAFITGLPFLFGAAGLTYGGGAASNGGTESSIVSFYQGNADRFAQLITAMSSMTGLSWSGITRLSP